MASSYRPTSGDRGGKRGNENRPIFPSDLVGRQNSRVGLGSRTRHPRHAVSKAVDRQKGILHRHVMHGSIAGSLVTRRLHKRGSRGSHSACVVLKRGTSATLFRGDPPTKRATSQLQEEGKGVGPVSTWRRGRYGSCFASGDRGYISNYVQLP